MTDGIYLPTNTVTIVFALLFAVTLMMLVYWHTRHDNFDLRDALTSPGTDGVRRVDTSKALLVGVFLVSSYLLADNYSDVGLGIYMTGWIANGGAVLWYKTQKQEPEPPK